MGHAADRARMNLRQNKVIQAELGEKGITWHFIPARASHMGGVFERMIGLLKTELKKLSGGTKLAYQELKVHVLETQRILNNRPLIRAKASLDDLECISPMDLIRGYKDKGQLRGPLGGSARSAPIIHSEKNKVREILSKSEG